MTNEELCELIQSGESEMLTQLIEQNSGMIHKLARRYLPFVTRKGGADYDDLAQAACIGVILAAYRWEAARGAFITIASYCMIGELSDVAGIRTSKREIEADATILSLEAPMHKSDDGDATLMFFVEDVTAVDLADACAEKDAADQVHRAVSELPPALQSAINRAYFSGERWRKSPAERASIRKGLQLLSRSKRIRELQDERSSSFYRNKGVRGFSTSWSSVVEDAVIDREKRLDYIEKLRAEMSGQYE